MIKKLPILIFLFFSGLKLGWAQDFQDVLNRNNYFEVKAELAKNPELVQKKLNNGFYPIHLCARDSKNQSLLALIELDSLLNKRTNNNFSALYLAIYNRNYNAASLLYLFGADTLFPDYEENFSEFVNKDELFSDFIKRSNKSKEYFKNNIQFFLAGLELGIDKAIEIYGTGKDIDFIGPYNNNLLHIAARDGKFEEIKKILKIESNINLRGVYGYTALHLAARNNNIQIYDYLINKGANELIESDSLETPYIIAVKHNSNWIIEYYKNKNSTLKLYQEANQLWDSLKSGNGNLKQFEDKRYLFELKDSRGQNIIHQAVIGNDFKTLKWVYSKNKNLNHKDIFGYTPLMRALINGNYKIHNELIKLGADTSINLKEVTGSHHFADLYNKEALQYLKNPLAYLTFIEIIEFYKNNQVYKVDELLKDKKVDLSYVNPQGISLAHWAASRGHKNLLDRLKISKEQFLKPLSNEIFSLSVYLWQSEKIDVIYDYFNRFGMNESLSHITLNSNESSNYYLKNFNKNPEQMYNTYMLQESILKKDDKQFKKFIKKKIDILFNEDGWNLIHYAARSGKVLYVKGLIKKGIDINQKTDDGYSPLFLAAYNHNYEVIQYLFNELNSELIKNDNKFQNLLYDSFYFEVKLILEDENKFINTQKLFNYLEGQILKGRKLEIDKIKKEYSLLRFKNEDGKTFLHLACEFGKTDIVKQLLSLGFNPNELGVSGKTPIFFALKNNHFECADLLISNGAIIDFKDKNEKDPADYCLTSACLQYYNDQLKNNIEKNYCQILYLYAELGKVEEFKNSPYHCNINNYYDIETKEGILHGAIRSGEKVLVQLVLSKISNPDFEIIRGDSSYTALDLALSLKKYDLAELLIRFGSNTNYIDNKGKTLFQKYANDSFAQKILNKDRDYSLAIQLFEHVEKGDYQKVDELLKKGANPNLYYKSNGIRAIHIAARDGYTEILQKLIEFKADVNVKSKGGFTPIYLAWYNENLVDFYLLFDISNKSNLNPTQEEINDTSSQFYKVLYRLFQSRNKSELLNILNDYSLKYLLSLNDTNILSSLVKDGYDIYKTDVFGWNIYHYWSRFNLRHLDPLIKFEDPKKYNQTIPEGPYTPFILSIINGNYAIAQKLMEEGADTSNYIEPDKAWISLAERYNQWELIEQVNPNYPGIDNHKFWEAVYNNKIDIIQSYLNRGLFNINSTDSFGFNILHYAARNSYKDFDYFNYVISLNPDINKQTKQGWSPLMLALYNANFHYANKLIELGANIELRNNSDSSAFQILKSKDFAYGKDFFSNPKQVSANYELTIAVNENNINLLKFALEKGADPNFTYPNLLPPLAICIRDQKHELVDLLLQYKANVNNKFYTDEGYNSLLFLAILNNNWTDFKKLIRLNADINFISSDGISIKDIAKLKGYFYQKGLTNLNEVEIEYEKYFLLKKGIELNSTIIIDQALYLGADYNAQDPESGLFPIQMAISGNKYEALKHLIFRGIDKNIKVNYEGEYIGLVEYAIYTSLDEMALILINSGLEMPNIKNLTDEYLFNKKFKEDWQIIKRDPVWFEQIGLNFYRDAEISKINPFVYQDSIYSDSLLSSGIIKTIWLELALGLNSSITFDKLVLKPFYDLDWAEKLINQQDNNKGLFEFSLFLGLLQKYSGLNNLELMKLQVSLSNKKKFIFDHFVQNPQYFSDQIFQIYSSLKSNSKVIYKPMFLINDTTSSDILNFKNFQNFAEYKFEDKDYNSILYEFLYNHKIKPDNKLFLNNSEKNQYLFISLEFALRDNNNDLIVEILNSGIPINSSFKSGYYNRNVLQLIFDKNRLDLLKYINPDSLFSPYALESKNHFFNILIAEKNDSLLKIYENDLLENLYRIKNADFIYSLFNWSLKSYNSDLETYLWSLINQISELDASVFVKTPYNSSTKNIISYIDKYIDLETFDFSDELMLWTKKYSFVSKIKTERGESFQDIIRRKQYFEYQRALLDPQYISKRKILYEHINSDSISPWLNQNLDFLLLFKDNSGNNLLQEVYSKYNKVNLLNWLFKDKRFYNNYNHKGENIYHNIAQEYDKDELTYLIFDNDLLVKKDNTGRIPLHYAIENKEIYLIYLLKNFGTEIKTNEGLSPLQIAESNSCEFCKEALLGRLPNQPIISKWTYDGIFQDYMSKSQYDSALIICDIFLNQSKLLSGINSSDYSFALDNKVLALGYKGLLIDAAAIADLNFENQRKLNTDIGDFVQVLIDYALIQKLSLNYQKALVALEEAKDLLSKKYIYNSSELSLSVFEGLCDLYLEFDREDLILIEYQNLKDNFSNLSFINMVDLAEILKNSDTSLSSYYYDLALDLYLNRANKTYYTSSSESFYVLKLFNYLYSKNNIKDADELVNKYKKVNDTRGEKDNDRWFFSQVEEKRGNYPIAISYLDTLLNENPDLENISKNNYLYRMGLVYWKMGDTLNAYNNLKKSTELRRNFLNNNFIRLSEDAKAQFINDWSWSMEAFRFVLFSMAKNKSDYYKELFELDSYLNGLALNSSSFARNYIKNTNDPELQEIKNKINFYRGRILKYNSESVDITDPYFRQLNDSLKLLESQISNISFQEYLKNSQTWNSIDFVSSKLAPNEAYLSIIRVLDSINSNEYNYYGLLIKSDASIQFKYLCNEDSLKSRLNFNSILGIHSQIKELYSSRGGVILEENAATSQDLYELAWANLDSSLQGLNTIWYNPTGYYNKIAVSALKSRNLYLAESYRINQISHPSVLFNNNLFVDKSKLILVGGLKYDGNNVENNQYQLGNSRSLRSGQKSWIYLPGTQEEIIKIKNLGFNKNWATLVFSDSNFKEQNFIKLNQYSQNAILHIATHGFYISNKTKISGEFQQHDPLEDAGLILSGGNKGWQGLSSGGLNDGILTGREIANTDLSGLYLVSLSACETGLGEIQGNEGVFGLPRAFKLAGVNYIISSLWQVPDKQTAEFMELFYSYLLNNIPIEEAFRNTQIELSKKYEPWFWAGFVLSR